MTAEELEIILQLLCRHVPGREVRAFGSRVGGVPKTFSDLDLVIMGGIGEDRRLANEIPGPVCPRLDREAARLQTFPDNYIFRGAWTEAMRQLGNAVPVLLAETVARSVANTLAHPKERN